ncbi:rhodanese-like domain-containing protein [Faecalibacter bovis]|uniref:Rhodanese-like domain-containing protein n=1 Tax=Faecalibacter bovis TaxID=2898187 RepID=A0ABX7XGB9_9FLAO|nr:rhodanese-like domain-containing protein [Faecalibacter bovis]MBS7332026.1 rhodanese-like domain-containing protein [Weeksellaceae bacterium]QTV06935.1 rhodanese-like domain-containing protein [Faecalibacter bovis]
MGNKIVLSIALVGGFLFTSCQTNQVEKVTTTEEIQQIISSLNNVDLVDLTDPNNVLIDVRTPEEFAEGHVPGAINLNVKDDNFGKKVSELDSTKNYYIYCRSGVRAKSAEAIMLENNLKKVHTFQDGMLTYKGETEK